MFNKKFLVFNIFYWKYLIILYSQQEAFTFIGHLNKSIEGTVKINYNTTKYDTATIFNNQFVIKGHVDHSAFIILSINDTLYSDWFYLDAGLQKVSVDIVSNKIYTASDSRSNIEHTYFKSFKDSLKLVNIHNINYLDESEYYLKVDSFLFSFVKNNRDSYFGLYNLSSNIPWYGLKNIYLKTFNLFSNKLKKSTLGKETLSEIKIANKLAIDQYFPSSLVYTIDETKVLLSTYFKNNKYTLIDVWSSTCPPCIQQFEELNRIYSKYKSKKFEIIGISNDTRKYKKELISAIEENQLQWPQLWDIDESLRKKYHILSVPRSYLLNKKGKIVLANFDLADLNIYLDKHLLH